MKDGRQLDSPPISELEQLSKPPLCVAFATHNDNGKHGDKQHAGNNSDNDRGVHSVILSPLLSVGAWLDV
jgi:hypothetical protein